MQDKGERVAEASTPTIIYGTVTPRRARNADVRPREFLTAREVGRLREAAGDHLGRHGHHNATSVLLAYQLNL